MSEASDLAESISRARVLALKAYEMDPELPEAHDILAIIAEQLDEGVVGLRPGLDAPEPMAQVRLARSPPDTSDGADVGEAAGDSITVISVDPNVVSSSGGFRRDSTSIFESSTQSGRQLRAASAGWANRTGRMASMDPARIVTQAGQLKAAGRTEDAIRLHEQTLEVRERVLGLDHPDTLASRNNLAGGYHAAGRMEVSLEDLKLHPWLDHAGAQLPPQWLYRFGYGDERFSDQMLARIGQVPPVAAQGTIR